MKQGLSSTLVLCDLDALMLGPDGNMPQVLRDVLQLFAARGGQLTVFSQKTPKAVRTLLGSVPLAAPAMLCGGALVYSFAAGTGQPMGSFEALGDQFLTTLPAISGVGIALQMKDGATRVLRMNHALERHLRREWTPYLLTKPEGVRSADVLRVLLYQDARTIPALQAFEKALEDTGAPVRQERLSIKIQSSSGLSEEDIQRLVREAEAHASEDKKKQEVIEARNHADSLIYGTEKSLNDLGDKADAGLKADLEGKIANLRKLMEGDDAAAIKAATEELAKASHKLAEQLYQQQGGAQPGADGGCAGGSCGGNAGGSANGGDDVVDADYTEVKK